MVSELHTTNPCNDNHRDPRNPLVRCERERAGFRVVGIGELFRASGLGFRNLFRLSGLGV